MIPISPEFQTQFVVMLMLAAVLIAFIYAQVGKWEGWK